MKKIDITPLSDLQSKMRRLDQQRDILQKRIDRKQISLSDSKIRSLFLKNPDYQEIIWLITSSKIHLNYIQTTAGPIYSHTSQPEEVPRIQEAWSMMQTFDPAAWANTYGKGRIGSTRNGTEKESTRRSI